MEEFPAHEFQSCNESMQTKLTQLFAPREQGSQQNTMQPPSKRQRMSESFLVNSFTTTSDFRTIYLEAVRLPQDTLTSLPQTISYVLIEKLFCVNTYLVRLSQSYLRLFKAI